MIAFGVNFNVYFLLYMRRPKDALHCEEMHWYLGIIVAAALMICANAYDVAMTLDPFSTGCLLCRYSSGNGGYSGAMESVGSVWYSGSILFSCFCILLFL